MQGLRDLGNALAVALISVGLMIGALSISLVEFVPEALPTATNNLLSSPEPLTATPTTPPTLIPTLGLESPTPSITPTSTNTPTPPSSCQPPAGWTQIAVQVNDTLDSIAARYRTTKEQIRSANCLFTDNLISGSILYVPPAAPNTPVVCIPGMAGWTRNYVVQPGDVIFRIGYNHYTTIASMMAVNCRRSEIIYPGDILWVPNVATRTPFPSPLPGVTVTFIPTETSTQIVVPITATPSDTPVPPTATTAPTNTSVPTLTASPTPFPTNTP
jgi:LysM repeat protein